MTSFFVPKCNAHIFYTRSLCLYFFGKKACRKMLMKLLKAISKSLFIFLVLTHSSNIKNWRKYWLISASNQKIEILKENRFEVVKVWQIPLRVWTSTCKWMCYIVVIFFRVDGLYLRLFINDVTFQRVNDFVTLLKIYWLKCKKADCPEIIQKVGDVIYGWPLDKEHFSNLGRHKDFPFKDHRL